MLSVSQTRRRRRGRACAQRRPRAQAEMAAVQVKAWEPNNLRSVLIISIRNISNRGSRIPEPLLMFTSKCPLKVQISQVLGPFFQI